MLLFVAYTSIDLYLVSYIFFFFTLNHRSVYIKNVSICFCISSSISSRQFVPVIFTICNLEV